MDVVVEIRGGQGEDAERTQQLADELADDLREIGGVAVRAVPSASAGGKSGAAAELGQLVLSSGGVGVAAWAVRDVLLRFLERSRAESITLKNGDREVTVVRPTDGQVDELLDRVRNVLDGE
jgi:hypothetical protein